MPQIKTYARVKPSRELFDDYDIIDSELLLRIPDAVQYYSSPTKGRHRVNHKFTFESVLDHTASQETVFSTVAHNIVEAFLNGYNGSIFAYGQTGTGKTYTMEGSARRYTERGLAPRAVSMIYKALENRPDEDISVHVSFLEIYQEVGYDLLNPAARGNTLVMPFPRVSVLEAPHGGCMIRNLSTHLAASEEVAQNLLLQGEINRKVAETPVNQKSSRSHAVFTIQLSSKKADSDVIVRSKLHLVDLAGSERVAKTGVDGQQLNEAKSINLSLHHLETVIIALQSENSSKVKDRSSATGDNRPSSADLYYSPKHVPYRNSLLTMVLRDSLGGNCLTAMVATVSLEFHNLGETVSTCRFAQRVACIANCIRRNEELDDKSLIKRLRKKISELETEIAYLRLSKGCEDQEEIERMSGKLTDEDKLRCARIIQDYIMGRLPDPVKAGISNPFKFRECMKILKAMLKEQSNEVNADRMSKSLRSQSRPDPRVRSDKPLANETFIVSGQPKRTEEGTLHTQMSEDRIGHSHSPVRRPSDQGVGDGDRALPHRRSGNTNTASDSVTSLNNWNATGDGESITSQRPISVQCSSSAGHRPSSAQSSSSTGSLVLRRYKSPYEHRQERQIRKLNSKVEKMSEEQVIEKELLERAFYNTKIQELELITADLEGKVKLCEEQISDQQAYINQLRDTEAESGLLEQEELVENHLHKRQARLHKKLELTYKKIDQLHSHFGAGVTGHTDEEEGVSPHRQRITWQEKFGQYRKRDGSLNTRQVFDMLQSDKKRRSKDHAKLEEAKVVHSVKQLELKEAATRQKLLEFKEMLKQKSFDDSSGQTDTNPLNMLNGTDTSLQISSCQPFDNLVHTSTPVDNRGARSRAHDMDRHRRSRTPNREDAGLKVEDLESEDNDNRTSNPAVLTNTKMTNGPLNVVSTSSAPAHTAEGSEKDSVSRTSRGSVEERSHVRFSSPESREFDPTSSMSDDRYGHKDGHKYFGNGYDDVQSSNLLTYMPSEYINSVADTQNFDARRMGLSSKTFESALNAMLERENVQLFSHQQYDKFARNGKPVSRPVQTPERRKDKVKLGNRRTESSMVWGPEAKNTSISTRLNQYLNMSASATVRKSRTSGMENQRGYHSSSSWMDDSRQDVGLMEGESGEGQLPKVKAIPDEEKEVSFMSRAKEQKDRITKIRKAQHSAAVIQRSWRRYRDRQISCR